MRAVVAVIAAAAAAAAAVVVAVAYYDDIVFVVVGFVLEDVARWIHRDFYIQYADNIVVAVVVVVNWMLVVVDNVGVVVACDFVYVIDHRYCI